MLVELLFQAACVSLFLPGGQGRVYPGRKKPASFAVERRRVGPHVCFSGFGSGCCPGWMLSPGSGQCTLPPCSFGCGRGLLASGDVRGPANGVRCTDIDECLSAACEGLCVNTEGGFVCECGPGMQLSTDRHSCQGARGPGGRPGGKRGPAGAGSYRCSCRPGYHLHGNRHSCVDVNECRRPGERRACQHACHNTPGSYLCSCRPGYRLSGDRVSCEGYPKSILAPSPILQSLQHPPTLVLLPPGSGGPLLVPRGSPSPHLPAAAPGTQLPFSSPSPASPATEPEDRMQGTSGDEQGGMWGTLGDGEGGMWGIPGQREGCFVDDNGVEFPIGQIWSPGDPCELCICQADGSVSCKRTDCVETCPYPIRIPGQCCPDCSAGCTYMGRIFYNNETFPSVLDPCLSCICLLGSVACSPVDCAIFCTYPFHLDCGLAASLPADCNYQGRKVVNGQTFTPEGQPCTRCTCQLGEVSCEKRLCPRSCAEPAALPAASGFGDRRDVPCPSGRSVAEDFIAAGRGLCRLTPREQS
ncbi:PREDICTED: von Willebrand factor C and EGF domain-containing protein [Aptenodytes forsteri]|uniref:von Willebrand factor C and EGF domain-containing protein n=1 Tax=Aptenodytes forsteri TaxID=9233 RepID=UPI0009052DCB|nr:PREDICTED: von Willebrand factor C and EGF domain-containing protein [Aptenodytes forsteri]